jgi:hypothetical protein
LLLFENTNKKCQNQDILWLRRWSALSHFAFIPKNRIFCQPLERVFRMSSEIPQAPIPGSESAVEASGFMTRAMNVFMSPGELFDEVRQAPPSASTWSIPMILSTLLLMGLVYYMFSTPTLRDQAMQPQREAMQKQIDSGKITADQAEKAEEFTNSPIMSVIGAVTAGIFFVIMFFVFALVLWLGLRFVMKFPGSFGKVLEVTGLTSLIGALGILVAMVTMTVCNSIYATPSASLLVYGSFNIHSPLHALLKTIDLFVLWEAAVAGIGLSRLAQKPASSGMTVSYGLYALYVIISVWIVVLSK